MIKTCERGRQEHPVCGDRGSFMTGTMFFNMLLNIGLLVLLATLLTIWHRCGSCSGERIARSPRRWRWQ